MNRKQSWLRWHALRSFFESREAWAEAAPILGLSGEIDRAEYERLLYGTDADAYVPLWASACLTGEDILLNETTLELIRFYKKYGYVPAEMDGNPPDYAGQQCRFLEYLSECALREPGPQASRTRWISPATRASASSQETRRKRPSPRSPVRAMG